MSWAVQRWGDIGSIAACSPATDGWNSATLSPLLTPRGPAGGAISGVLYAVGGFNTSAVAYLATNEAYTP
jgi:hypothetical protein